MQVKKTHLKHVSRASKLSTLLKNTPLSPNNSRQNYNSALLTPNPGPSSYLIPCKRTPGFRRSMEALRNSHCSKQNLKPRLSVGKTKGTSEYEFIMEVGEGAFGKVWKVRHQNTKTIFALKAMLKSKILTKNSVDSVLNERVILAKLKNSKFIVNALKAFQDGEYLYLLMEYMPGGDLRYIIYLKSKCFTEEQAKFLICCLIVAVKFLHRSLIIHRDIKPENLVLDAKGYLRLTDMGISKMSTTPIACDGSGTPAYMSPEAFEEGIQAPANDIYAIGVIAFELLNGRRPFTSKCREQIYAEILSRKPLEYQQRVSEQARLFCQSLLNIDPGKRLGSKRGVQELENHPWFSGVNWAEFRKKKYKSPFSQKHSQRELQEYQKLLQPNNEDQFMQSVQPEFQFLFKSYNYDF